MLCRHTKTRTFLTLALVAAAAIGGCTSRAPWAGQGREGFGCFADKRCDPGLICIDGFCRRPQQPGVDGTVATDTLPPQDAPARLDGPTTCPPPPNPPLLKNKDGRTYETQLALRGNAAGAATVEASIIGGGTFHGTVSATGAFCLEIDLLPGQASRIEVIAYDGGGCPSAPARLQMVQLPADPKNVLAGMMPSGDAPSNELALLTDGKTNRGASFNFFDSTSACDEFALVSFALKQAQVIERIVVRYPWAAKNNRFYMQCWSMIGTDISPPPPDTAQWHQLGSSTNSKEDEVLEVKLDPPLPLRYISLAMFENGAAGFFSEDFAIAEIEAWTPARPPPFEGCR